MQSHWKGMKTMCRYNEGPRSLAEGLGKVAHYRAAISLLATSLVVTFPNLADAQTVGQDPATMVNNICSFILGPFGQSIAVLGIVAIGLAWMFGRASLGLIAGVIGGVVIMFGASYLGQQITGGS